MPITAYIGLGSNVGDKQANVQKAIELLRESVRVMAVSSFYTTEPVGYREQEDFINAVVGIETEQSPEDLLAICRSIESRMGRERTVRWGPRTIDLDILLYGNAIVDHPGLMIPHPRMISRKFVLVPLVEIAPDAVHPITMRTASQLLQDLQDPHTVIQCKSRGAIP
jgi:2-amino-4-hydroxy-6-hydroxymethyldihydropteridine diphosphokinase/dihydroneopterin aldolase/2-amino-4-hydroxy-6-hydroxymethyldihydropteridine diphosphokinase